jgi:C-terminal processing protease CtpA/Prc
MSSRWNKGGEQSAAPTFYKRQNQQESNQIKFTPRKRPVPEKPKEPDTENDQNTNNLPVEQVAEGSRAEKAGLKLGDSIVKINGQDTSNLTLAQANQVLEQASQKDIKLGITK